jgi:uncharacterized HAD superfamily protein|tara:strand:+ start:790 stop:1101 length:312 start_codon:yes stop_codon:yes gene_type:complete
MKFVIDIDNTICREKGPVINRKPFEDRIKQINKLYDEGHEIIYHTARGLKSGRGEAYYRPITEAQLELWGCKYHELCFKQHDATFYIDDKNRVPNEFFNDNLN